MDHWIGRFLWHHFSFSRLVMPRASVHTQWYRTKNLCLLFVIISTVTPIF